MKRELPHQPLLEPDEPDPVVIERDQSSSAIFITCDHADHLLPRRLGDLGISEQERQRHIGWDIGALEVATQIADHLRATLVAQRYSRLVIDCNRQLGSLASIPESSEDTEIPGNEELDDAERSARADAIHRPYHDRISGLLEHRARRGQPTMLVAMHSFTPVWRGEKRPWHIALSSDRDRRVHEDLLARLGRDGNLHVGDDQPYKVEPVDYTIPVHGAERGLPHVQIEVRQDLITDGNGQAEWAERLGALLRQVAQAVL